MKKLMTLLVFAFVVSVSGSAAFAGAPAEKDAKAAKDKPAKAEPKPGDAPAGDKAAGEKKK
jgi:hypothetical protein